MTTPSPDPACRPLAALPMLPSDPADLAAIIEQTAKRQPPARWSERLLPFAAAAAAIALALAGARLAQPRPRAETGISEAELARLEADVDLVLHRLGAVLRETERLTLTGLDRTESRLQ